MGEHGILMELIQGNQPARIRQLFLRHSNLKIHEKVSSLSPTHARELTPISYAVALGRIECARELLKHKGSEVLTELIDRRGTLIDIVIDASNRSYESEDSRLFVLKLLLAEINFSTTTINMSIGKAHAKGFNQVAGILEQKLKAICLKSRRKCSVPHHSGQLSCQF